MNVYTPSMAKYLRIGLLAVALALPLAAVQHQGQVKFGGQPLPGATVTAVMGDQKKVSVTDQQGVYTFPDLGEGTWNFEIEMLCFSTIKAEVAIAANAPSPSWDMKLLPFEEIQKQAPPPPPPSPMTTNIPAPAATSAAKPADTAKPKGKQPVLTEQAKAIQNQGGFRRTEAKEAGDGAKAPSEPPPPSEAAQAAAPAPSDGLLINGSTNNGAASPFAQMAAFGNNRRGGRSLYNGNIGFQLGNSALDARQFSLTGQNIPKPSYNYLAGMAAFGGPIKLPWGNPMRRPNFMVNYQFMRSRNVVNQTSLMPTDLERGGDFSQTVLANALIDPTTGQAFPGNIIPQNRLSPQALALLRLYPAPNFASSRYNYQVPIKNVSDGDNLSARINKTINNTNQLSGQFAFSRSHNEGPNLFGFVDTTSTLGSDTNIQWVHRFSQRQFGTTKVGFNRQGIRLTPYFSNVRNISGEAGINGNNQEPINWGPPRLAFTNGTANLGDAQASHTRNQTLSLGYDHFWSRGAHNFRIGGDLRRQQFNLLSQQDPRGTFTFTGSGTGWDFADFLLGSPTTTSIAFGNADKYLRANMWDAYFTDDWRISSGFTLNAGFRWEYNSPISENYGRLVNLDIAPAYSATAPLTGASPTGTLTGNGYPGSLIRPDRSGFQPRIGFAWHPILASSLTIRGGYGIYYDTSVYMSLAQRMIQQFPFSKSLQLQNSPANPLTLANGFNAPLGVNPITFAVDPNYQVGYAQNFQLSVQRDLPKALMFTATYLGIKGTRARQEFLPNTYPAGAVNPCPTCPSGYAYVTSNGNSMKHSGTVQVRRRLANGFTSTVQYTYSKAIDNAMLGGQGQSLVAQNWLDLSAERGLSSFDQRHNLNVQAQYSTGVGVMGGALLSGWRGRIFKEWTIATQLTAGSGRPLSPLYPTPIRGFTNSVRPLYTGAPLYDAPGGLYLNPAAFAAPLPGQWGNAGRHIITGPNMFSLNASLARTFRISDRVNTDLRLDATNALNTVTYQSWVTTVTSAQFGLPTAANNMRTVRLNMRVRF
jgi:trimeric autotransporter adhesin